MARVGISLLMRGRVFLPVLVGALLAAGAGSAHAQSQSPAPVVVSTAGGDVTIVADSLEQIGADNRLVAIGNVEITRGNSRLIADRVEIDRATGQAIAQGSVVFYDGENQVTGQRIDYNLKTGTGVVYQAEVRAAPYYRIAGETMERLGESVYRVRRGSFTTCEDDPPPWSFRFGTATADLEDFVYGTNASFWVRNVPLIPFFPFFAAAIRRERQTGFLFPKVGSNSRKGLFAEVPFYWAISDSQDLTVGPQVYTERGAGVTADYRYLLSEDHRGRARGFLLHESEFHGDTRGVLALAHDWRVGRGLRFTADINAVTDDEVFHDYGDPIQQRSAQRVESNVFVTKSWESWNLVGNLFWYQDLTESRPVELQRLPDINLQAVRQPVPGLPGFLYETNASYVNFVRDVGSAGSRFDVHPRLSRPFSPGGLFTVTPYVGGRLTAYDKSVVGFRAVRGLDQPIEVTEDEGRLRRLVEAGTDVEMNISRVYPMNGRWGYESVLHSIEPRVTYGWVAGEGQHNLPMWTESVDRIRDGNRVEYSVINRLRGKTVTLPDTDPVRWEMLRLTLGHSYEMNEGRPGVVRGDLIVQPTERLRFRTDSLYSVDRGGFELVTSDMSVTTRTTTASLGHRYSDLDRVNYLQGSVRTDLTSLLTVRAATEWDIRTGTFVENRVAADVKFQCWAVTVEFVKRERDDTEVRFAVNLLGVGGPIQTSMGLGALQSSGQK
jgi:LPS-assembly protein